MGTVVSGTCLSGVIRLNDPMHLGPDGVGSFHPVAVRSIQRKRLPVSEVRGSQTASFALKKALKFFLPFYIFAICCNRVRSNGHLYVKGW